MAEDTAADTEGEREDRLLLWSEVHALVGISRTTAWRLQQTGAFPNAVALSPGRIGWWESELEAWRKNRTRGRWRAATREKDALPLGTASRQPRAAASVVVQAPEQASGKPPEQGGALTKRRAVARRVRGRQPVHPDQMGFDF